MRRLAILVCLLLGSFAPAAAQAQTVDRLLGLLGGAAAYGYNSCSYVGGGIGQASCQASRALSVVGTLRQNEYSVQSRRREDFDRRGRQLTALQRACTAGDARSCERSGGSSPKQMEIARALMEACSAGDKGSCRRAEGMMDERSAGRDQRDGDGRYDRAPVRSGSSDCRPVIDRTTGYRIVGAFDCN